MRALIRKLCCFVHRLLCYLSIHSAEEIVLFDYESVEGDVRPNGWLCRVCSKQWALPSVPQTLGEE